MTQWKEALKGGEKDCGTKNKLVAFRDTAW